MSEKKLLEIASIVQQLYQLCKDDRLTQVKVPDNILGLPLMRDGIPLYFDKKDNEIFDSIIQQLITKEYIKNYYTIDELSNRILDMISHCLRLDLSEREGYIEKEIKKFRKNRIEEIQDFIVLIPIINLKLTRPITIGNVKISPYTKSYEQRLKKARYIAIQPNLNFDDRKKKDFVNNQISFIEKWNNSRSLCYAEIIGRGLNKICDENALNEVRIVINVLKLYWEGEDERLSRYFGIKGETIDLEIRCIPKFTTDYSKMCCPSEHVGSLDVYHLDKKKRDYMRKNGFNQICEILLKPEKDDIEISLIKAIYWFGESTNIRLNWSKKIERKYENLEAFPFYDRFLKLFIALESLLIFSDGESLTDKCSERVALLLGENYEDRVVYQKDVRDQYNIRSKIVHTGKSEKFNEFDLFKLQVIVQKIILALLKIKNKENIDTKMDLKSYIDKLKYS